MRSLVVAGLLVATAGYAGSAVAQDFDLMQYADTNNDGKVTPDEYNAFSEQGWGFFAQGAEKVKLADLDPMAKPAFAAITPDADGYVTHVMYTAAVPAHFKALDKNGDGFLSAEELNATMKPPADAAPVTTK